jgi:hypothetical protein
MAVSKIIVINDMACGEKIIPATKKNPNEHMETKIQLRYEGNVEEIAEFNQAVLSGLTVKVGFEILPPAMTEKSDKEG